jgi:hypothetical protein
MNPKEQLESPPDTFISPLLELRDYYSHLLQEYQRLFIQARTQLDHVEALLSNWSFANSNEQLSRLEAADEDLTLTRESSLMFLTPDDTSDVDLVESIESEIPDSNNIEIAHTTAATPKSPASKFVNHPPNQDHSFRVPDIPMQGQYQNLSRMEAIKQLLQEYIGTVCHIDFIVRSLYGDLESHIFRVVKGRVQSSLTQGRERNAWAAMPDEPGCYTLDLSLVIPTKNNSSPYGVKSKRKKPFIMPKSKIIPMLRAFEGQFLIDAITVFFEQNPGKIFSVAEVVNGIYGELDSEQLREVKNKVLNELSRGHRTGRFSRVPDKIGFYTWDLNSIRQRTSR